MESTTYSSRIHNSTWMRSILRVWLGCAAFVSTAAVSEAQTYYYYPSSGTNAPGVRAGQTTTPTYYYRRGLFGRFVRSAYTPQYYQPAQVYQPAVAPQVQTGEQAVTVEAPQTAQIIPVSYSTESPRSVVVTDADKTAATTGAAVPAAVSSLVASEAAVAAVAAANDPYGFVSWLNATRAAYGLPAVGHDPNLSSWAAENNNHQAARGMGHFVMGPARRQNAAFGAYSSVGTMWMNSPAHRGPCLIPPFAGSGSPAWVLTGRSTRTDGAGGCVQSRATVDRSAIRKSRPASEIGRPPAT